MPLEINEFFEKYRDAFNALDGLAVAQLYAEPSGIAQDGTYAHWPTRQAVADNMTALCTQYRNRGYVGADFEPGEFLEHGPNHAMADVQWRIHWDRGQETWHFRTAYNLLRSAQGWKVLLCTAYSETAQAALHRPAVVAVDRR